MEAELWLRKELEPLYGDSESAAISNIVVEHITGLDRVSRQNKKDEPLNVHQLHTLTQIRQRMAAHEPMQYILGEAWFAGLKLFVDKSVLIPRPETEELVKWIIDDIKQAGIDVFSKQANEADETTKLKIMDAGTGSGCIALALKNAMPKAEVWGCDVSEEALNVARRNGSDLNIRVDFQGADLLDKNQHKLLPTVDIIVSNPPYVPVADKETMQPHVKDQEPHIALFVPDTDPLIFYKMIADLGNYRLYPNGKIYCEIYEGLANETEALFKSEGYSNVETRKDMSGKFRMLKASR